MTDGRPTYGVAETVAPGLARIIAPNPSPMTFWGTNTFLAGKDALVIIDPGPADEAHLAALLAAIGDREVTHILVTHSHLDHSPLACALQREVDAPICAYGPSDAGRSEMMTRLASEGLIGGGEGVDTGFAPDLHLRDGVSLTTGAGRVTAIHTPGHFGNHMCFEWDETLLCGDLVMGWASSLVSPPDGDLGHFLQSCQRLRSRATGAFYPAHGPAIAEPLARLDWLIAHRRMRSEEILKALKKGRADVAMLTRAIYTETPRTLWPAASRNVLAHLVHLVEQGRVQADGPLRADAVFELA